MHNLNLHRDDLKLLTVALRLAVGRRQSMVRANVGRVSKHDREAEKMNELQVKLLRAIAENPGERDFHLEPRP